MTKGGELSGPDTEGTSDEASDSTEAARMKQAGVRWQHINGELEVEADTSSDEDMSPIPPTSSLDTHCVATNCHKLPLTSGLFDYSRHLLLEVLSADELSSLKRVYTCTYKFAEFCAGTATGTMCVEALRRAAATDGGFNLRGECVFYTELDQWKRSVIATMHATMPVKQLVPALMFERTGDLSKQPAHTADGSFVDCPVCQIAFCGIVCVDVSSLSTTPKSVMDPTGKSGSSFLELMAYLRTLTFEDRPNVLILECVSSLDHQRKLAKQKKEKGTTAVISALSDVGYVGHWTKVCSKQFYLPHSRARVWGVFLKLKMESMGHTGRSQRELEVEQVFAFVQRCKTPAFEPLSNVMERISWTAADVASAKARKRRKTSATLCSIIRPSKWLQRHMDFKAANKLELADLEAEPLLDFKEKAAVAGMGQRELEATLLRLALMRKRGKLPDWRETILVGNIGANVERLQLKVESYPCLTPRMKYLLLVNGEVNKCDFASYALAIQGIQEAEAKGFGLVHLSPAQQQELAGNAFSANVCVAFLLAVLVVLGPVV